MKITNIKLKNFRKHKDLSIDLSPLSTEIKKPNWWGKTTIADAIFYLFTDKPMTSEKNYSPKPMKDGEEVHGLDSVVSITFDNGLVLTKTFSEKWETKRGSIDKLFTGNKTEYEINGVPKTKGDFDRYIEDNIATKEQIQSLLNPSWWCDNKPTGYGWENRRTLLLEILGEVDESQIMTEELKSILNGNPTDEAKKIFKATMKKINEELKEIPNRLDEISITIANIEQVDEIALNNQISSLEKEKDEARLRITELSNEDEQVKAIKSHYNTLKTDLIEKKGIYIDNELQLKSVRNTPIREQENLLDKLMELKRKQDTGLLNKQQELLNISNSIIRMGTEKDLLLEQHSNLKNLNFVPNTLSCPTCNQSLPVEQIKDMESKFNKEKSDKLLEIQGKGVKLKEDIEKLEIQKNNINIEGIKQEIENTNKEIMEVETKIKELKENIVINVPFEETEEYKNLQDQINKQKEMMDNLPSIEETVKPFNEFIKIKTEEQDKLREKVALSKTIVTHETRIKELEEKQKELSSDYLQSEKALYLIERYEIEKVKLLDDAVNRTFDTLRFRMFKPNISNDGIQDTCDVLVLNESGLVPYQSASTSEKIRANFELIQALSNYWNIDLPIIVDNGEAIETRNRPVVDKQVLWLCVE